MPKKTLSVVISAFNEAALIEECLQSVSWADEIVLVDNSSTDTTVTIAKKYTKTIYKRPNNPMLNVNKNFGFGKAKGDWILSLDADERVDLDLKREVESLLTDETVSDTAYQIPRKNIIFGKWIEHTGWYPDYQIRIFKKNKGSFAEKHVHELLDVGGTVGTLKGHLTHYNYSEVSQFIKKMDMYTDNEVQELIKNDYQFSWTDLLNMPKTEFLNRYFLGQGYRDGLHGLALSLMMASYHLFVAVKLWEKNKFEQKQPTLKEVQSTWGGNIKETRYWFRRKRVAKYKHKIKRLLKQG